jgi:alpha-L-rhamnosidase
MIRLSGGEIMRRPTYCALFITALCLAWAANPTPAFAQGGQIRDPKCEDAVNPRGVKTEHPQFSWTWGAPTTPRAYQILVASSEEKLKADIGDLWDSGQVRTDQKTARYEGKALGSLQHCYWKLRVWSDYDTPTLWTEAQTFQMALLSFTEPETK